ncbi:MAG TPA: hypothetical protein VGY48_15615 [Vicinamibacterales bacterium]|nr:hypothetical protein [Vicinamibacterales bacterium]
MRLVIIESPFAHDKNDAVARHRVWRYVRVAMRDCLMRGEAPFASHALYTQEGVLSDWDPSERALGIAAGFAWGEVAALRAFYIDIGRTSGMLKGIEEAKRLGQPYEERTIPGWEEL